MKTFLTGSLVVILGYGVAILTGYFFGVLYDSFFSLGGGLWGGKDAERWLVGWPLAIVFFVTFLLHTRGGKNVWWWNVIALAPVILFEIKFDFAHIYLPMILGLAAWGLGAALNKTLMKTAPALMAKIS